MDLSKVSFEMGSYSGFVEGPDRTPNAASLTFTAVTLDGLGDGVLGAFSVTTEADASGAFSIDSLPLGTYRVQVIPPGEPDTEEKVGGLGAREGEISACCRGRRGARGRLGARDFHRRFQARPGRGSLRASSLIESHG